MMGIFITFTILLIILTDKSRLMRWEERVDLLEHWNVQNVAFKTTRVGTVMTP
jgi:hypothetical protein